MKFYIDGDAFPNLLKPIITRVIDRLKMDTFVIANKRVNVGQSRNFNYEIVRSGPDEADNRIVELVKEGDLVITADIPLADRVISKNAYAIDHRGELYTEENIKERLSIRDYMQELRNMGVPTQGPAPYTKRDATDFINQLDRFLTKLGLNKR